MTDSDILIQSEVGGSYDRHKYNGLHLNNIGSERGIGVYGGGLINVESDIPQNNTRTMLVKAYTCRSEINKLYIQHLVSRV